MHLLLVGGVVTVVTVSLHDGKSISVNFNRILQVLQARICTSHQDPWKDFVEYASGYPGEAIWPESPFSARTTMLRRPLLQ